MIKILKDSFNILKNNMLFIQPILLFLLFVFIGLPHLSPLNTNLISKITLNITLGLLFCAFCSGWFYINKLAVESYTEKTEKETEEAEETEEITKKSIENLKQFFTGVGTNFLNFLGGYTLLFLISLIIIYVIIKICIEQYGLIQLPEIQNVENFFNTLSQEDKITLSKWILTIMPISFLSQYLFVLYSAILLFDKKNIFITLFNTIKFFFKNIILNIGLIILLPLIQFIIHAPAQVIGKNTIGITLNIIATTIYFAFYTMVIFRLYSEKTKISSNNRAEFSGEDSSIDSSI